MRRRALLGTAATGIAAAAGCLGLSNPAENVGVPANESDCPPTPGDRVVCVPESDPESASVAMTADSRSGSLPTTFAFTLTNGSGQTLSTNYYGWNLWKRVDGEWHHIVPDVVQQPLMRLNPGSRHEWRLTAEHVLPARPGRDYTSWESAGTVGGLGGGEYAFTIGGWFGDADEGRVGFAVLFDVDAPELTLEPTARVIGTSRDGDVVTVRGEESDLQDARPAAFVLTRVDDADDPRRLIPEQAVYDYRLRNTLPFFESGADRVRFVEENTTWPVFGVNDPYSVRYRGELYRVTATELGTESETTTP
ncbi:hypothetical protein [Halolamina salifodinae]|uniref:Uncharacterized protein n=1 Tax=Halolamina salifodinae TaxID=1202767 RepID=A0A8T4GSA2_9EURY|nr:hypothetical protein [Halolamina salifodinae]MBP1985726.1 hypothetical protein [Halolamina salifodinae]